MSRRGNGEGSVFRRADGRWVGEAYVLQPNGGRARRTVYGRTREEVAAKVTAMLSKAAAGHVAPSSWTVAEFVEYWLDNVGASSLRATTLSSYRWILANYVVPEVGSEKLAALTPPHVRKMLARLAARELSWNSRRLAHSVLRTVLADAVREQLIERNAAALVKLRREHVPEVVPWTPVEAARFLAASQGDRLYALFAVGVSLGLRRGELMGLRWEDVDLRTGLMRVEHSLSRVPGVGFVLGPPKSARSRRALWIPEICLQALRAHWDLEVAARERLGSSWQESGYVFTAPRGGPLDPTVLAHVFERLVAAAGVRRIRLHDLRHTCASLLLAQGVAPRVVMEVLGHAQLSVTMDLYSHVMPTALNDAAKAVQRALDGPA